MTETTKTARLSRPCKHNPELQRLLELNAKHTMTAEELNAQRCSWVRALMGMLGYTEEEIDRAMEDPE